MWSGDSLSPPWNVRENENNVCHFQATYLFPSHKSPRKGQSHHMEKSWICITARRRFTIQLGIPPPPQTIIYKKYIPIAFESFYIGKHQPAFPTQYSKTALQKIYQNDMLGICLGLSQGQPDSRVIEGLAEMTSVLITSVLSPVMLGSGEVLGSGNSECEAPETQRGFTC